MLNKNSGIKNYQFSSISQYFIKIFHCGYFFFIFQGEESSYENPTVFQCLPCADGCDSCEDNTPCIATLNWVLRTILLILQCVIIGCLPVVVLFTYKYKDIKVKRYFILNLGKADFHKISRIILSYLLVDCFEIRVYLAGRCLCS